MSDTLKVESIKGVGGKFNRKTFERFKSKIFVIISMASKTKSYILSFITDSNNMEIFVSQKRFLSRE